MSAMKPSARVLLAPDLALNRFPLPVDCDIDLRLIEPSFAEPLFALIEANREELRRWLPWVDRTRNVEDLLQFVSEVSSQATQGVAYHATVWWRDRITGSIGIRLDRANRRAEMGYWLARAYEGRGIMTRACRALVEFGFQELGLNRIEIRCAPGNRRSRAIPERLGFLEEAHLRQMLWVNDDFQDMIVYSRLAGDPPA